MAWGQPLGLDELMIVNPSSPDADTYFLGEDGTLYQVQGLEQKQLSQDQGQYFLGDDGTLYQVQGLRQTEELQGSGQYFFGNDDICQKVFYSYASAHKVLLAYTTE